MSYRRRLIAVSVIAVMQVLVSCIHKLILYIMPGFLKTGLAKIWIMAHSTTWQLKTIKFVQRPIKSDAGHEVNGPEKHSGQRVEV